MSLYHSLLIIEEPTASPVSVTIHSTYEAEHLAQIDIPGAAPEPYDEEDLNFDLADSRLADLSLREVRAVMDFVEETAFYIERLEEAISETIEDFWEDREKIRKMLHSLL